MTIGMIMFILVREKGGDLNQSSEKSSTLYYQSILPGSISFRYPAKCDHAMPTAKLPAGNRLVIEAGA